jgi:hypothetical protein
MSIIPNKNNSELLPKLFIANLPEKIPSFFLYGGRKRYFLQ